MQIENIFPQISGSLDEEVVDVLAEAENVRIERIISQGHTSPEIGWYDQEDNEWVLVLQGNARITFEDGSEASLTAGSYLNIPAHTRHKVSWTDSETETVWLAVHYSCKLPE